MNKEEKKRGMKRILNSMTILTNAERVRETERERERVRVCERERDRGRRRSGGH